MEESKYPTPALPTAITGESLAFPTFPPLLALFIQVFRLRGATVELLGIQALGDCTSPVRGCLGEEPKVGKESDDSVLVRSHHGKSRVVVTRGTSHL